jgi:DNA-binding NarL/FixJ family response regulator
MTADAYVLKSHDFSRLKETIRRLLNKNAGKSSGREAAAFPPSWAATM